jgi:hypothetical protein
MAADHAIDGFGTLNAVSRPSLSWNTINDGSATDRHAQGILLITRSAVACSSTGFFTRFIHIDPNDVVLAGPACRADDAILRIPSLAH